MSNVLSTLRKYYASCSCWQLQLASTALSSFLDDVVCHLFSLANDLLCHRYTWLHAIIEWYPVAKISSVVWELAIYTDIIQWITVTVVVTSQRFLSNFVSFIYTFVFSTCICMVLTLMLLLTCGILWLCRRVAGIFWTVWQGCGSCTKDRSWNWITTWFWICGICWSSQRRQGYCLHYFF